VTRAEAKVRSPSDAELHRITGRAVAEIIPKEEFVRALRSGRRLRLKMGFDPTVPVITLGWAVGLRKLRQLQELGHTVVVIIGDWTARIGDPSGESQTRPMLSEAEVKANSDAILRQFYRVLDPERTEIRRQSEWFDPFSLTDVVRLAARFTVAQMLQRDDFAQRFEGHRPIGLHELLYPLLQAYDSVATEADVEFGGTDQKFNILVGRELQGMLEQRPQCVLLVPLLVGLDGAQKMSQSLGNYIGIEDTPHDMYGKIMSIPDSLLLDYFELLTDVPEEELAAIRRSLEERSENPMEHKMRLAREIVSQFHSAGAAGAAEGEFVRVFRKGEAPEEVREYRVSFSRAPNKFQRTVLDVGGARKVDSLSLPKVLLEAGFVQSISEARRLIKQGAVDIDGDVHTSEDFALIDGLLFRIGKHRFLRIVDADKQG